METEGAGDTGRKFHGLKLNIVAKLKFNLGAPKGLRP
jgi:hypothetical protein